jgi:molecular chaperone DnaJ
MSEINNAWRVLSDPGRRAMYDAELRGITVTPRQPRPESKLQEEMYPVEPRSYHGADGGPPPFPWRLIGGAVIGAMVVGFIVSGVANRGANTPQKISPVIEAGSCVVLLENGDAKKVSCDDPHEAVVERLIGFDLECPLGTTGYRDPQGMGTACVVPAS